MSDVVTLFIVNGALCLLAVCSALTWTLILQKVWMHWRLSAENRRFAVFFWTTAEQASTDVFDNHLLAATGPKARVARAGLTALSGTSSAESGSHADFAAWDRQDLLERLLCQQIQRERRALESGLTLLASIANVAPFVGLFGTVFGIIHALHAVASGASGGIEGVAGPVGQALVATGVGIAVAVPAVLAYNLLLRHQRITIADLEDYAADLVNLAQRNGFRNKSVIAAPASSAMPFPEREASA
jgi:biopolymer transport protein ExbB